MTDELFFEVEELLCKQDVEKLKLFAATLGIDGGQIKTSKGRRDLNYIIIKVREGKLDEEGKTDEEKCDIFKHIIEDLKFYNGGHGRRGKMGRKMQLALIAVLIMMVKVIIFHPSYVS